jgi:hydroxymethylbilane synthase
MPESEDHSPPLRLGTRASQLAMWQSNWVKSQLESAGVKVELVKIQTQGDVQTGSLAQIGGQGVFTKQIQIALLNNEIDLAVHSLKDLPTEDIDGLKICAIPERETTADALISPEGLGWNELPAGSVVGTGSVRRAAQLLHLRDDLQVKDIRGNVDTRLKKLDDGEYDAIILASAGLTRLGWSDRIGYEFSPEELLPAVGQGALGLEIRVGDKRTEKWVKSLNHEASFGSAMAERVMLRTLFAGCLAPVGARTIINGSSIELKGVVLSRDGKTKVAEQAVGPINTYQEIGKSVAEKLINSGADKLLRDAKE